MSAFTFNEVVKELEALKVQNEYTVFSANDLIILEMAYIRGQQSQIARELAELKEVA
jgi:hypothetical protein